MSKGRNTVSLMAQPFCRQPSAYFDAATKCRDVQLYAYPEEPRRPCGDAHVNIKCGFRRRAQPKAARRKTRRRN